MRSRVIYFLLQISFVFFFFFLELFQGILAIVIFKFLVVSQPWWPTLLLSKNNGF